MARLRARGADAASAATGWFDRQRERRPLLDLAHRFVDRDAEVAGGVLGSAVAFRIFLFVAPLMLMLVGLLGFAGGTLTAEGTADTVGVGGQLAQQIAAAFEQSRTTRWVALLVGFVGAASAGRSLTKVLVVVSARAWRDTTASRRAGPKAIAAVVSLLAGLLVAASLLNRVRLATGVVVTTGSLVVAGLAYGVVWFLISLWLPRKTDDPTALVPGAALVGASIAVMQWALQFYLPDRLDRASSLYGSLGATLATLGVLFLFGRVLVAAMVLDAVVWERFGSIAELRIIAVPARALARLRRSRRNP